MSKCNVFKLSLEPHLSLAPQQKCPSPAQKLSVPHSGPVSQKQFHSKLIQRLKQVLNKNSRDCAPQVPTALQTNTSDISGDSKVRSSSAKCSSTVCTHKELQGKSNSLANGKSEGQMPLKADVAINKTSVESSTSKAPQEKIPPSVRAETNRDLSNKDKV